MIGLLKPDAGHVWIDGVDVPSLSDYALNDFRRRLGMVFQYAALFDSFSVEENIAFPLVEHTRMTRVEVRKAVDEALRSLQLPDDVRKKFPAELSGGQRKRVGLARALVLKPEIILYDEPTTGLDPIATKNVDDMIRDISQATGVTSIVVSHDMASTFRHRRPHLGCYTRARSSRAPPPTRFAARPIHTCAASSISEWPLEIGPESSIYDAARGCDRVWLVQVRREEPVGHGRLRGLGAVSRRDGGWWTSPACRRPDSSSAR